ncbi:MAG: hypothetical protein R3D25_16990 [Geminicoccaceae bacterium]
MPSPTPYPSDARQFCFGFISGVSLFYTTALQAERIKKVVCSDELATREQLRATSSCGSQSIRNMPMRARWTGLIRSAVNRWPCKE